MRTWLTNILERIQLIVLSTLTIENSDCRCYQCQLNWQEELDLEEA